LIQRSSTWLPGRTHNLKGPPSLPINSMKVFRITGTFQMGRVRRQKFVKEVAAEDEARAREVLLSDLGSKHGTPRRRITIAAAEEVPEDRVESSVVRAKAGILR